MHACPCTRRNPARTWADGAGEAFTLVEMLVVMAIIVVLIGICVPVISSIQNAGNVNKAVDDMASIIEQSRTYAMANNTYVYLGIAEFDVTQPGSKQPQTAGTGRVALAVAATKDGTQGFSTSSLPTWSTAYPAFAKNLTIIAKPLVFDNLHIPDFYFAVGAGPATGHMVRPALSSETYCAGSTQCLSATPFTYPVGSALNAGQYTFTKVIQFDSQGVARMQTASAPTAITSYLEIDLQQTHGTAFTALPQSPPPISGNIAALQIDGMTGGVRTYRP
jgi:prepilin-type N-terminal cleavage/methylation domain-containing protein